MQDLSRFSAGVVLVYSFYDTPVHGSTLVGFLGIPCYLSSWQQCQAQISAISFILRELFKFQGLEKDLKWF